MAFSFSGVNALVFCFEEFAPSIGVYRYADAYAELPRIVSQSLLGALRDLFRHHRCFTRLLQRFTTSRHLLRAGPSRFPLLMSGLSLRFGVSENPVAGFLLRVFNPAKTVADGFKFRNKIGLDVATQALKESRRLKKASMDELWAAAKVCRVANVMGPYLESL